MNAALAGIVIALGLAPPAVAAPPAGAPAVAMVAALTDTAPWIESRRALTPPHRDVAWPVTNAGGEAAGGLATIGGGAAYGSRARGALLLGGTRPFSVEVRAGLLTLDRGDAFERRLARSEVRLKRGSAERHAWAGVAFERSLNGSPVPTTPLLGLGGSLRPGTVTLAFSIEQTVERARIPTVVMVAPAIDSVAAQFASATETRLVRATSALVSGRWARGRIGIESVAGLALTPHVAPSHWMQTSIDVAVRPRVALYAMAGDPAPRWLALEPGLARRASFGLKLTSADQGAGPLEAAWGDAAGGIATSGAGATVGGRARGALRLGGTRGLSAEVRAAVLSLDRGDPFERRLARSEFRLQGGTAARGAWAGVAIEHSLDRSQVPPGTLFGMGGAIRPGAATLRVSIEQTVERAQHVPVDVLLPPAADSLEPQLATVIGTRLVRATSALVSGRWTRGRIGVETVAGVSLTPHVDPSRWMQASVDVTVRPRLALYATFGDPAPRWLALEPGLTRRASLGLRLSGGVSPADAEAAARSARGPGFHLRRLGDGWYVVEVHAKAAGPVEVMGDFSGWEPRPLRHVTGDRWALALRMEPGVHQIQARVDGGSWQPPGGLPVASDGFSGDVGVFIAP